MYNKMRKNFLLVGEHNESLKGPVDSNWSNKELQCIYS